MKGFTELDGASTKRNFSKNLRRALNGLKTELTTHKHLNLCRDNFFHFIHSDLEILVGRGFARFIVKSFVETFGISHPKFSIKMDISHTGFDSGLNIRIL